MAFNFSGLEPSGIQIRDIPAPSNLNDWENLGKFGSVFFFSFSTISSQIWRDVLSFLRINDEVFYARRICRWKSIFSLDYGLGFSFLLNSGFQIEILS